MYNRMKQRHREHVVQQFGYYLSRHISQGVLETGLSTDSKGKIHYRVSPNKLAGSAKEEVSTAEDSPRTATRALTTPAEIMTVLSTLAPSKLRQQLVLRLRLVATLPHGRGPSLDDIGSFSSKNCLVIHFQRRHKTETYQKKDIQSNQELFFVFFCSLRIEWQHLNNQNQACSSTMKGIVR